MAQEFKSVDYVKESIGYVKANLVPCAVAGICGGIPVIGGSVVVNYLRAKKSGTPLQIGQLFNFENLVPNFLASLSLFAFMCCFVPGALLIFTMPIMADRPGTEWMNAIKASLSFGKKNLVPQCIMVLICGLIVAIPVIAYSIVMTICSMILPGIVVMILSLVGLIFILGVAAIGGSVYWGAIWSAYNDAKAGIAASAAEAGVTLA